MIDSVLTHSSPQHVLALQQSSMNHAELSILLNALHHVHDLAVDRNVLLYKTRIPPVELSNSQLYFTGNGQPFTAIPLV